MMRMPLDWALDCRVLLEWAAGDPPGGAGLWTRIETLRAGGSVRFWISTASLAAFSAGSGRAWEQARLRLSAEAGRGWRPFTADAQSALDALACVDPADPPDPADAIDAIHSTGPLPGGPCDWEIRMAHAGFRRVCPEGRFLTRDPSAPGRLAGALPPELALAEAEASGASDASAVPPAIPMLDLREEYRLGQASFDRALLDVAASARYILGPEVGRFETSLAGYLGAARAVGVSSGTEALLLSLRALAGSRLGRERFAATDLVITTPFTFVATGTAILRAGATPLFVDIDPISLNLDLEAVRRVLRDPPGKVAGILPVHLFGRPCPMDGFRNLADEHGLFLLEDAAQAFGASWGGARVGSLGDMAAFSFFPSKNLGAFGDAGAVSARDPALAEAVAGLLMHGGRGQGTFDVLGYNARLDSLQAAVLLAKLPGLDLANRERRRAARAYRDALAGLPGLELPDWPGEDPGSHVFHQFTVRTARRDGLKEALARDGIASMIYYAHPLHRMPLFAGRCRVAEAFPGAGLPEAERAAREVLSLPIGPAQGDAAIAAVAASVRRFLAP